MSCVCESFSHPMYILCLESTDEGMFRSRKYEFVKPFQNKELAVSTLGNCTVETIGK